MKFVKGSRVKSAKTLSSQYDMDSIELTLDTGRHVRIKAFEIQKMAQYFRFTERKARKHTYLELFEYMS